MSRFWRFAGAQASPFRFVLALAVAAGTAVGLAPMAGDEVVFDGPARLSGGAWSHEFSLVDARPAGLYLALAGVESFEVRLNDSLVATVEPGPVARTLVRALDFSDRVGLLRPNGNRLTLFTDAPADSFDARLWASPNSWFLGSSHTHTVYSDGALTVHELLARAAAADGRFLGITDHNTLDQCYDTAFHAVGLLEPIRGTEWTSDSGHANLLGLAGPAAVAVRSVPEMIDDASYRGAVVHINHPRAWDWRWHRYPLLDPGIDGIELMNGRTGFAENEELAVEWWHDLLVAGHAIAGIGSSDFHGDNQHERPLVPCSRVRASSTHPDTLLRAFKLGRVMACDRPDGSRVYLYADTSGKGYWNLAMGDFVRVSAGARPVRFRVEAESVSPNEELRVLTRHGELFRWRFSAPGDFSHEWSSLVCSWDSGFVRAELVRANGRFGVITNPVYVNYPGYEFGPVELVSSVAVVLDRQGGTGAVRLDVKVENRGSVSPYRFGVVVALDTAVWDVLAVQPQRPGPGAARRTKLGGYHLLEWLGGWERGWRLRPGESAGFWAGLRVRQPGIHSVLYRSWADDRLFEVAVDPDTGLPGPGHRPWRRQAVSADFLDARSLDPGPRSAPELSASAVSVFEGRAKLTVDLPAGSPPLEARVLDVGGRSHLARRLDVAPGAGQPVSFDLVGCRGARLAPGLYFLHLRSGSRLVTRRLSVVE
ncbi:MAG: CehA/McbA family metallohydrolase [bacterium]